MKWNEAQLSKKIDGLRRRHEHRNQRVRIQRALLYRRYEEETAANTGTYVPSPFDKSKPLIKSMTGELMSDAQHLVAQLTQNKPQVNVTRIPKVGTSATPTLDEHAGDFERLLMACYDACGGEQIQHKVAWAQVESRAGWILTMEKAASLGIPDRLTSESVPDWPERAKWMAYEQEDGSAVYRENAELWERRKADARRKKAENGADLFFMRVFTDDGVLADFDSYSAKCVVIAEDVAADDYGPDSEYLKGTAYAKTGLIKEKGKIVAGLSLGSPVSDSLGDEDSFTLYIVLTRNEIYYMVSPQGGTGGGTIIYYTKHDYGEVPCYPMPFNWTASNRPDERFVGPLEPQMAYAPIINTLTTMQTNLAIIKGTPRVFVEMAPGQPVVDERTSEIKTWSADLIGADPEIVQYIEAGGRVRSVAELLQDDGSMMAMLELLLTRSKSTAVPDAATGHGGDSGPAWGKRLMQQAHGILLQQAIGNYAAGLRAIFQLWARIIRARDERVGFFTLPDPRGKDKNIARYIDVEPEWATTMLAVQLASYTQEEWIARSQIGMEKHQAGYITKREFFEDYEGDPDPDARLFELDVEQLYNQLWADLYPQLLQELRGMLTASIVDIAPNTAQAVAQQIAQPPNIAGPAGIRQPGVGMSVTQPDLAALPQQPPQGAMVQAGLQ